MFSTTMLPPTFSQNFLITFAKLIYEFCERDSEYRVNAWPHGRLWKNLINTSAATRTVYLQTIADNVLRIERIQDCLKSQDYLIVFTSINNDPNSSNFPFKRELL